MPKMFKILNDECLKQIPWAALAPHEAQALSNHSQGLARLDARGGLSVSEALAVMQGRRWHSVPDNMARYALMQLIWEELGN